MENGLQNTLEYVTAAYSVAAVALLGLLLVSWRAAQRFTRVWGHMQAKRQPAKKTR